jgi:hypothetical protein
VSIEVIQKDRKLECGWINVMGKSWPGIGVLPKPKAKSIHGICLTSKDQIRKVIEFLQLCEKEMDE